MLSLAEESFHKRDGITVYTNRILHQEEVDIPNLL